MCRLLQRVSTICLPEQRELDKPLLPSLPLLQRERKNQLFKPISALGIDLERDQTKSIELTLTLQVDVMPLQVDVMPLQVNVMPLQVDVMPLQVDVMTLQVDVMPLQVDAISNARKK